MTPEERQLITGLFDRMRNLGNLEKDRDADALINDRVRSTPDAAYMLVQSVLVQEQALQQAERRIRDLEDDAREMETSSETRSPASGGGFLGGLFGGGRPVSQPGASSVPPIGSRAGAFPTGPMSMDRQGLGASAAPQTEQAGGGGSFMRSAMATAAGVAGGMLAAGAIRDLLGGSSANASTAGTGKDNAASGNDGGTQQASNADAGNKNADPARENQADKDKQDDAHQDASDDSSSGWDDGGDFDI